MTPLCHAAILFALLPLGFLTCYYLITWVLRPLLGDDRPRPDEPDWFPWNGYIPEYAMPRPVKTADEHDVVSRWRHMIVSFGRPGKAKAIKTRLNRRYRHEAKHAIREGREP